VIPGDETDPPLGHGTPVAGIVSGASVTGMADGDGFLCGLGVAPVASLYSQNMCFAAFPPQGGWQDLSRRAVEAGAAGSNNSWWQPGTTGYTELSRTLDFMVRDGDFDASGVAERHPMVFIAGNAGPGASTVTTPAEAKNVIVVGATEYYRLSDDMDAVTDFSRRGPTDDGRIVSTVMAPGEEVATTRNDGGGPLGGIEIAGTGGATPGSGDRAGGPGHLQRSGASVRRHR
jgi:hypothetical protein